MVDFFGWYPRDDVRMMVALGRQRARTLPAELAARPPGQRVMQLRWLFVYEADVRRFGADPIQILERGFVPIGRTIRMLRPVCNALKRQNIIPDAVWIDTEAGFQYGNLNWDLLAQIFANPRIRANMPASLQNVGDPLVDFHWTTTGYRDRIIAFDQWTASMMTNALRRSLIDSGLFKFNTPNGIVIPPMCRYGGTLPTWPVYDPHGWPLIPTSIDAKTSNPFFYYSSGNRVSYQRFHDYRWNLLIDICNWARSFMSRQDGLFWPLVTQPSTYHNSPWYFEQIIAHLARTGVTSGNNNGWIFWNENDAQFPGQPTLLYDIIMRHAGNYPAQRSLPELQMDTDSITTGDFTTTYADFLANIGP